MPETLAYRDDDAALLWGASKLLESCEEVAIGWFPVDEVVDLRRAVGEAEKNGAIMDSAEFAETMRAYMAVCIDGYRNERAEGVLDRWECRSIEVDFASDTPSM